jgi:hypothetical protein
MNQVKCPKCGSRTTDVELESYDGRCMRCRQSYDQTPMGGVGQPEAPPYEVDLDDLESDEAVSRNMIFGALWCFGGVSVTALTWATATAIGLPIYVVASGAILFGATQFIRGVIQKAKRRRRR